ncbi:protein S100-A11 [Pantherophis guttatus]|uniref:Protein S100-A11 n=1 Tax=Pantherophis guttatus TaxID=94885 RepID=A0ABM3ZPH1_PANGU|nr:protein S100-A11 [Pantherophis guttatus]
MSSKYPVGPTETERCIESLLAVFQSYAGRDGDGNTLSRKEFKTFMNIELGSFTKNQKDPGVVDRMMKALDRDNNEKLDFSEFLNLIGSLALTCHAQVASPPTTGPHQPKFLNRRGRDRRGSTGEGPNPPFTTPVSNQLTSNSQVSSLPSQLPTKAMSSRYPVGPTETERCIESLLAVFQRYAGKDGKSSTLSKREFKTFMDTELASFTKSQKDPGVVDRMMKKLDMNNDGQLDFPEFLNLIGGLATACHEHMASAPEPHKRL